MHMQIMIGVNFISDRLNQIKANKNDYKCLENTVFSACGLLAGRLHHIFRLFIVLQNILSLYHHSAV